jgi:NAD(P)-dependent dehydrogenase (short-subunit alcohol dehydrogenase family)
MPEQNRIAIVTGGSRGLGANTVLALAKREVNSIFTYNSGREEANKIVAAVADAGAHAVALPIDMGKAGSFDAFVEKVHSALADWGVERFDFLVNNAGMSDHTPFTDVTEDLLDRVYSINFKGVFFLTQKLLPLINDGGRIINISSGLTRFWTPNTIPYASLKGAIEVFTHYLAKEVGPRGITVNAVAPGAIATDFSGGVVRDNPEINKQVARMTALGRVGQPGDIGQMIASLLSDGNHWVTAQRIEVSGGMNL